MGVFVPFWQGGLGLRLVALVVPIQPFAYVVANYSCHDRNNESNKYIHRKVRAPSLCRYRGGNKIKYSIISFKSKGQKALFLSEKIWKNECFFLIPLCHRFARRNVRRHLPGGKKSKLPWAYRSSPSFVIFVFLIQKLLFAGYFYHRTSF